MEGRLIHPARSKGQTTVEFFFSLVVFLLMLFLILDVTRACYTWASLQYAASRGIRQVKMIGKLPDSQKKQEIKNLVLQTTQGLGVNLPANNLTITINFNTVTININMALGVSRFTGILLSFGGHSSHSIPIHVFERIRNEPL